MVRMPRLGVYERRSRLALASPLSAILLLWPLASAAKNQCFEKGHVGELMSYASDRGWGVRMPDKSGRIGAGVGVRSPFHYKVPSQSDLDAEKTQIQPSFHSLIPSSKVPSDVRIERRRPIAIAVRFDGGEIIQFQGVSFHRGGGLLDFAAVDYLVDERYLKLFETSREVEIQYSYRGKQFASDKRSLSGFRDAISKTRTDYQRLRSALTRDECVPFN